MDNIVDRDLSFGRLLRRLRKARDLTQAALAQQAYCAVDTIKKIEQGLRRPSRQLAEQFADCLALMGDERAAFLAAARSPTSTIAEREAGMPPQPTPLVGRALELAALGALFQDPATRLITITGPGGIGKTRLAIALAEQLLADGRFADGGYFVPLAPLDTPERIVPTLAEALGIALDAGKQPQRSLQQRVFGYLAARRLLLVLDNIEHLLGAETGADAAGLVAALLEAAPGVAILATSRERLQLRAEHVYPLEGLDVPGDAAPPHSGAVALFVQRAQQLLPTFAPTPEQIEAIARICRLVEGMPLAIELAAGWAGTLAPSEIAAEIERGLDLLATELRDVPERHRSMRAVFGSAYRRLGKAEQAIFARLAVFRGGGTLAALQAVSQATLAQIQALIGASLLAYDAGRGRYTIHELLRQYAAERLGAAPRDEAQARERHAAYFLAFVQRQAAELPGFEQHAALAALGAERDNLRAAWAWAADHSRADLLAQAADGLGYFYEWRADFDEGERAYQGAAAQIAPRLPDERAACALAMLQAWQGNFRRLRGDIVGAEQLLRQGMALLESLPTALDTRAERAFLLLQLGLVASEGPLEDARHFFEQSLALYQALGRRWEASHALLWLGDLARYQGAFAEARQHFRASLAIRSDCGDPRGVAEVLIWDSHTAAEIGEVDEAEALARRSYALHEALGDSANRAFGLGELGVILMYTGKYAESCRALEQSLRLYQDLGNYAMQVYAQGWLAVAFLAAGRYDAARALSQQAAAQARELRGAQLGLAFVLHYAGWVALTLGAHGEAAALIEQSVALHRQAGNTGQLGWPLAQLAHAHWLLGDLARARAELLEVLRLAATQHAFLPLLLALPAIALMLAEQGHAERAAELYALAWRHPLLANAQNFVDTFGKQLDAVAATLLPAIAAAAQARGRRLDLWETGAALGPELIALGWARNGGETTDP